MEPFTGLLTLGLGWLFAREQARRAAPQTPGQVPWPGSPVPAPVSPAPAPVIVPTVPAPAPAPAAPGAVRKAVEVWWVDRARTGDLPDSPAGLAARKRAFPAGWRPMPSRELNPDQVARAKALLPQATTPGKALAFEGQGQAELRAYVSAQHTAPAPAPAPAPVRPATPSEVRWPEATIPSAPMAPARAPADERASAAAAPAPASAAAPPASQAALVERPLIVSPRVVTVERGEGPAQIAARLGQPARWRELVAVNIPQDAGGKARKKGSDGGFSPGLQPGDRLFVPAAW